MLISSGIGRFTQRCWPAMWTKVLVKYPLVMTNSSPWFFDGPNRNSRVRSEGRQKACRPTAPKMGPRRSASQRNVSKGAGMPVLFCSKHDCHKQCQDMRTASGSIQDPRRNPRHPQISKLTYFRTPQSYTRKGSKTSFCEWQR